MTACSTSSDGMRCPLTGMCIKTFVKCFIAMLIWVNLFSGIWHSVIMGEMYEATAELWRGPDQMIGWALYTGLAVQAFIAAFIFLQGYKGGGWPEGVRFGVTITLFLSGMCFIMYATQPIPTDILYMWVIADLIMYSVGGVGMSCLASCKKTSE